MLRISNMVTEILTSEDTVRVVDGLSLTLNRGEICALVGESGCGKSMTAFSLLRLLPSSGRVSSGVVTVDGTEIMGLPEAAMRNIRSFKISLIFQEPATSLNPVMTVGDQNCRDNSSSYTAARRRSASKSTRLAEKSRNP